MRMRKVRPSRYIFLQSALAILIAISACSDVGSNARPIVFLGDSIIAQNDWASFVGIDDIVNQGIVGDTIEDVIRRLDQTIKLQPRAVFILVGINNKPMPARMESMLSAYRRLINKLQKDLPDTALFIHSLIPIHQDLFGQHYSATEITNSHVQHFNLKLKELAQEHAVVFIDVYPHLLSGAELNIDWTHDGLHLNREGYLQWRPVLQKHIQPYLN